MKAYANLTYIRFRKQKVWTLQLSSTAQLGTHTWSIRNDALHLYSHLNQSKGAKAYSHFSMWRAKRGFDRAAALRSHISCSFTCIKVGTGYLWLSCLQDSAKGSPLHTGGRMKRGRIGVLCLYLNWHGIDSLSKANVSADLYTLAKLISGVERISNWSERPETLWIHQLRNAIRKGVGAGLQI